MLQTMKMNAAKLSSFLAIAFAVTLTGSSALCAADSHDHHKDSASFGVVKLMPTKGNKVRGVLRLVQKDDALQIVGKVVNLTPGEHGFHIHEFGDRRAPDGTSAGGHFNPGGHDHGAPGPTSHAGDLGNITANEDGVAMVDVTTPDTHLSDILGRSFVVHAGVDDLSSQPSGDAGPRVAVGVIAVGNPDYQKSK